MSRYLFSKIIALLAGISLLTVAYFHNTNSVYSISGNAYGTYWSISSSEYIGDHHKEQIKKIINEIDFVASNYKPKSEINIINMNFNENQFISDHLLNILIVAKKVEDISEGYYNIMMGKVSSELGFAPDFDQNISQKEISNYELNESDKSLRRYSENWFDLSSIAKGYAVQQIHEYLYSNNLRNHLIDIGGEIIVNGNKNGSPWSIGIQDPTSNYESSSTVIDNKNNNFLGIATSGEYRNYKIGLNGEKISHTINPRTLKSIENNTLSITVVDKSSVTYADAYATAFNAMGMEKAINIANKNEIAIMVIYDDGYGQDITYSNKWYDLGL